VVVRDVGEVDVVYEVEEEAPDVVLVLLPVEETEVEAVTEVEVTEVEVTEVVEEVEGTEDVVVEL
jgi:hypothetical protein